MGFLTSRFVNCAARSFRGAVFSTCLCVGCLCDGVVRAADFQFVTTNDHVYRIDFGNKMLISRFTMPASDLRPGAGETIEGFPIPLQGGRIEAVVGTSWYGGGIALAVTIRRGKLYECYTAAYTIENGHGIWSKS